MLVRYGIVEGRGSTVMVTVHQWEDGIFGIILVIRRCPPSQTRLFTTMGHGRLTLYIVYTITKHFLLAVRYLRLLSPLQHSWLYSAIPLHLSLALIHIYWKFISLYVVLELNCLIQRKWLPSRKRQCRRNPWSFLYAVYRIIVTTYVNHKRERHMRSALHQHQKGQKL